MRYSTHDSNLFLRSAQCMMVYRAWVNDHWLYTTFQNAFWDTLSGLYIV